MVSSILAALVVSAIVSLSVSIYSWRQRGARGNVCYAALMLSLCVYSVCVALALISPDMETRFVWARIEFFGSMPLAPLWLMFCLRYGGFELKWTRNRLILLWAIPVLTIVAVFTNQWHHLAWPVVRLVSSDPVPLVYFEHGPAVLLAVGYAYVLLFAGTTVLVATVFWGPRVYRSQVVILLFATFLPWAGNVLYMVRVFPFNYVDITPMLFTASGILLAWGTRRFRLFRMSPVGHATVLSHMSEGLLAVDPDGYLLDMNAAAESLLGISRARVGEPISSVSPEMALLLEHAEGASALEVKSASHPEQAREPRWLEVVVRATPSSRTGLAYRLVLMRDVTESRRAAQALRDESVFRGRILESIADGLCVFVKPSVAGLPRFTVWNRRMAEITGYSYEEISQTGFAVLCAQEGAQGPETEEHVARLLSAGGLTNEEWPVRRKDGGIRILSLSTSTVEGRDEQTYVIISASDVTERKALEAQLLQAQKLESVGRLAGGVAHDFNNMLSAIIGYTELALAQTHPSSALHQDLKEIEKAAKRSAELTQQLLGFGRKQMIAPRVIDIGGTVSNAMKMLQRIAGEDLELVYRPGQHLWQVCIDPLQVEQVLANLVVNARDAVSGNGTVTIGLDNVELGEVDCGSRPDARPGPYVVLTVSDTGTGMDEGVLEHLFEPFFTTKGTGKGTGLGLATVYGIAKQNGGFVDVASRLGEGSTFRFFLPRHEQGKSGLKATDSVPLKGLS